MSDEPQEQRGVHNPRVVDLIQLDPERDEGYTRPTTHHAHPDT